MTTLFSLRVRSGARLALALLSLLALMVLPPQTAHASHLRAGDIRATYDTTANAPLGSRRVFFRMVLYTDISNSNNAVQPDAIIFFGDGTATCDKIQRIGGAVPDLTNPGVAINIFKFEHTFPASGTYVVSFVGENRNGTVRNMATPASQNFYIATTVYLDPTLRGNRGVILRAPAIDRGAVGQIFLHNPAAYDADGDSVAFQLAPSRQVPGSAVNAVADLLGPPCTGTGTNRPERVVVPCTGYHFPNDPTVAGPTVKEDGTPPAIFEINARTGQLTWNAPVAAGEYNVAIEVREYRRSPGGYDLIGLVIRDMQITIANTSNRRPILTIPPDLCVIAGDQVRGVVTAVDGSGPGTTQTAVTLFAYAGILPPATFVQTQQGPPTATGNFTWNTACNNVAKEPYLVVFKAQDTPSPNIPTNPPLIDEKTWRITVVGPPPQNLRAAPAAVGNNVQLTWDSYTCTNAQYMYIYRKEGNSNFVPGGCITGIPASAGYTLIKRVAASDVGFLDNNPDATGTAQGLKRGVNYCYRIYAGFPPPALGESIASNEACLLIPGRAALLTKVDVATTAPATGQIQVCWTQPRTGTSAPFTGALSYVLARAEGLSPAAADFRDIATITALADTCYSDTNLNTLAKQYSYKLRFVRTFPAGQGTPIIETTAPASSVFTSAMPRNGGTAATVSWTFNVPWDNTAQPTQVYRKGPTGGYVQVGTATSTTTGGTYADNDPTLIKNQQYCYYVRTIGRYADYAFLNNLPNRSQERCLVLGAPPCTPRLTLLPLNCDSLANLQTFPRENDRYTNRLRWTPLTNTPDGCDANNLSYNVFYRPTQSGPFRLLTTTTATSYQHTDLAFSAGCYRVQAVAPSGLVSDSSNVVCQDNCLFFKLPNIFTPNGDVPNAVFRPKNYSPVRSIHFQAYNRWGVKVFENTTTANDRILINWDGGGPAGESATNRKVSDGVYFYLAEVEFADFANTKRTYKGWVEIVR